MPDTASHAQFCQAAYTAIAEGQQLSDEQYTRLDRALSTPWRQRASRNYVYSKLVERGDSLPDGTLVSGTSVDAIPWAEIIQLLVTILPVICPPKPTPSLPASGG